MSKKIKQCIRDKKEFKETRKDPAHIKAVKNISNIKSATKTTLIPNIKKMKKATSSHQAQELPMFFGEFYSKL